MARISAEQKKQVRATLLASAAKHFAEHGLAGANINRISTDAGYARGTIYNYFPSKEALFAAVLEGGSDRTLALYRASGPLPDTRARLLALAAADVAVVRRHEDFMKTFVRELIAATPTSRAVIDKSMAPLVKETIHIVSQGQTDGQLRADMTAPQLATIFLGHLTMGYIHQWRTDGAWPGWEHLPALTVTTFLDGALPNRR